ncbi:hypothetical protein VNO77_09773 [Canavalia gladiata]|uniref:Uncharacterized protein n=1 Tax=Canavalia gladiata TaxID=3824 RepID=A0AAN9MA79_CANGL
MVPNSFSCSVTPFKSKYLSICIEIKGISNFIYPLPTSLQYALSWSFLELSSMSSSSSLPYLHQVSSTDFHIPFLNSNRSSIPVCTITDCPVFMSFKNIGAI